jgi:hypothetical protein
MLPFDCRCAYCGKVRHVSIPICLLSCGGFPLDVTTFTAGSNTPGFTKVSCVHPVNDNWVGSYGRAGNMVAIYDKSKDILRPVRIVFCFVVFMECRLGLFQIQ